MNIKQLHKIYIQCANVCTDTRKVVDNDMFFALKGEHFNGNTFAQQALLSGAKFAVIDEKEFHSPPNTILVKDVLQTLQDLASYHRVQLGIPIIAITGSNGKTTTKELIHTTLSKKFNTVSTKGNLNNHIGVPLTLLSMNSNTEIGIVEMGANHLKEIEFLCDIAKPDFGYITNFGKAHLEGFGSLEGVIKGKCELYDYLISHNKVIFINGNDSIQVEKTKDAHTFSFGNKSQFNVYIKLIEAQPFVIVDYKKVEIRSRLMGVYNFDNISAAIAIADYFKVDKGKIKSAIEDFVPSNNRSQIINKGSLQIILDAYNANPTSMKAALINFENQKGMAKIAILGDMFELGKDAKKEHQYVVDFVSTQHIDNIFLVGENFNNTFINSHKIQSFKTYEDFEFYFKSLNIENACLLIKGSRGMALERMLDLLK